MPACSRLLIASMATLSVFAQDTLSTADVVFTDIHDSTQSLRPDSVAGIGASTAQAIAAPVTTAAHQSLWGIFLAGLAKRVRSRIDALYISDVADDG